MRPRPPPWLLAVGAGRRDFGSDGNRHLYWCGAGGRADAENRRGHGCLKISESSGVEIDKLLDTEELASLDPDTLKDIEGFRTETGLSAENLVAVNSVLEKLPADQVEHFVDGLETMVESGLADKVEKFMSDHSEIEGGAEAFFDFDGYNECVAGGV